MRFTRGFRVLGLGFGADGEDAFHNRVGLGFRV